MTKCDKCGKEIIGTECVHGKTVICVDCNNKMSEEWTYTLCQSHDKSESIGLFSNANEIIIRRFVIINNESLAEEITVNAESLLEPIEQLFNIKRERILEELKKEDLLGDSK